MDQETQRIININRAALKKNWMGITIVVLALLALVMGALATEKFASMRSEMEDLRVSILTLEEQVTEFTAWQEEIEPIVNSQGVILTQIVNAIQGNL